MTAEQAELIRHAIDSRLNIVVSGGTGSGKTTLANAVIAEMVRTSPEHRLVVLEDTAEIQCEAENAVSLHTTDTVDIRRLLKSTMRLRPHRIIVGEVGDGAALTLLKAWNTGHPGWHHNDPRQKRHLRIASPRALTAEARQQPMREVIGEAVDLVISIERIPKGRRVRKSTSARLTREKGFSSSSNSFVLGWAVLALSLIREVLHSRRAAEPACPWKVRCNKFSNRSLDLWWASLRSLPSRLRPVS